MPIYVYECEKCGQFEEQQSIHDSALIRCPKCGEEVRRIPAGGTSFILKGDGWYKTTYSKGSSSQATSSRQGR